MKETIFIANYCSEKEKHDRISYYQEEKTLQDYINWIQEERKKIEKSTGRSVVVETTNFIRNETS